MQKPYLDFLQKLSENNHKEWMDANRDWYLAVREEFLADTADLLREITEWESGLATLRPKDCVFRQNRDIRFSPNKQPYKNNFAAYFSVGGKKSEGPGYYLHIQPGASFIAGGIWMPPADVLKKIRQEIDYSGEELMGILRKPDFKALFGDLEGEKLKTTPRDFDADHPYIDLLRHKSFIVSTKLSDEDVQNAEFKNKAIQAFQKIKPFHDFLHRAVDNSEGGEGLL